MVSYPKGGCDMSDYMIKKLPAVDWQEALPLGNGTVGAMIYETSKKKEY